MRLLGLLLASSLCLCLAGCPGSSNGSSSGGYVEAPKDPTPDWPRAPPAPAVDHAAPDAMPASPP